MPGEIDKKYVGLLEKKWTSVIRLQKKVQGCNIMALLGLYNICKIMIEAGRYT